MRQLRRLQNILKTVSVPFGRWVINTSSIVILFSYQVGRIETTATTPRTAKWSQASTLVPIFAEKCNLAKRDLSRFRVFKTDYFLTLPNLCSASTTLRCWRHCGTKSHGLTEPRKCWADIPKPKIVLKFHFLISFGLMCKLTYAARVG